MSHENGQVPFPKALAKFNKVFTNRVMIRLSGRPPFGAIRHTGRVSGSEHRIPINVFPAGDDFVFALTYGPDADWVKNVMHAGGVVLEYAGDDIPLVQPRMIPRSEAKSFMPVAVRIMLRLLRVDRFLRLQRG